MYAWMDWCEYIVHIFIDASLFWGCGVDNTHTNFNTIQYSEAQRTEERRLLSIVDKMYLQLNLEMLMVECYRVIFKNRVFGRPSSVRFIN